MKTKTHYVLLLSLVIAQSCVQEVKQKEDSVETANEINNDKKELKEDEDYEFVTKTVSTGLMEVQLGRFAAEKAETKEVKLFATHMVEEHSKTNEQLQQLAQNKKMTLPTGLSESEKEMSDKIMKEKGIEFDKEYMEQMIKAHRTDIENFEKASKHCEDPDIKNWAEATLPALKMHLEMAEQTQEKIKNKKNKYD